MIEFSSTVRQKLGFPKLWITKRLNKYNKQSIDLFFYCLFSVQINTLQKSLEKSNSYFNFCILFKFMNVFFISGY